MNPKELLLEIYEQALEDHKGGRLLTSLPQEVKDLCEVIVENQEVSKGVLAVLITLTLKKIEDPTQDIRMHQSKLPGGFSGRGLDSKVVTPFLREQSFPYMASGSGWLTRSLEQAVPYYLDYPGQIRPAKVKDAFLRIIDHVEKSCVDARNLLHQIFLGLIDFREINANIMLARPTLLSVNQVVEKVHAHYSSGLPGSSRLPVLAIYAIHSILINELNRYQRCNLLALEEHTASDTGTGLIGDIHITNETGAIFEAFEIKHNIPLTDNLIMASFQKFRTTSVDRFYILTTHPDVNTHSLEDSVQLVRETHGCQLILNGVDPTLKYYLRLVSSINKFIDAYANTIENDMTVPYALKRHWNKIVGME